MKETAAEPLYRLIRDMRKPSSLRELMASCLRSIYSGNPFSQPEHTMPELPAQLRDEVSIYEQHVDGIRCAIYSPKSSGSRDKPIHLNG